MKNKYRITIFLFSFLCVLALLGYSLASVEGNSQKTPASAQNRAYWASPFRGPVDAQVEIAVFSDFQ